MPNLFSNEYSRGPLYQAWKARSDAQKDQRAQRLAEVEARVRSPPLLAANGGTYGPSDNRTYLEGLEIERRGLPGYVDPMNEGDNVQHGGQGFQSSRVQTEVGRRGSEELPLYHHITANNALADVTATIRGITDERGQPEHTTADLPAYNPLAPVNDSATAGSLGRVDSDPHAEMVRQRSNSSAEGPASPKTERRGSRVGSFFASAFSGYVPDKTQSGYRW